MEADAPIYVISVAAQLAHMHPQTLRQYDRLGLVVPQRRNGKHRRYSSRDVERLRRIQQMSAEGISLEGIRRVIELENNAARLAERVALLEAEVAGWRQRAELLAGARVFAAGSSGEVSIKSNGRAARERRSVRLGPFELTSLRSPRSS